MTAPDRLLLDEMFSPQIAMLLTAVGVDCVSVATDPLLRTSDDWRAMTAALSQQRIVVTNNVVDFERIRRQRMANNEQVPGLIYTDDTTFPRNRGWVNRVA